MKITFKKAIINISNILVKIIVGFIVSKQIKIQNQVIRAYKDLLESTNPNRIISLDEREVNKIKETLGLDKKVLENLFIEQVNFGENSFEVFKQKYAAACKKFNCEAFISLNITHS